MNTYFVLKATGKGTKSGRSAIVLDINKKGGKSFRIVGNIPELYHGMTIELELDENNTVLDYNLVLTKNNIRALEKAKVDTAEYQKILENHTALKNQEIGWNSVKLDISRLYTDLPFEEADKVHKEMVNEATEATRIKAINKKIIEKARQKRKIAYKIEEYLGYFNEVEQEGAYQQLMVSLKVMCLQASSYGFKNGTVWDNELKKKEDCIKENIQKRQTLERNLLTKGEIRAFLWSIKDKNFAREQLDTLWCLESSLPCIITGGAGTGKTTVIQALIDCYAMHYSRSNILLVAPTGKASRRLAEKTGMPASTIHRALRKNPEDDFIFYTEKNPLPYNLIVVDESSMIDTSLMYDLLQATEPTAKIVFVGDCNQLYPVGYGEPFFDFMKVLDMYRLRINHRQSEDTDILKNAENVLEGLPLCSGKGVLIKEIAYADIGSIISTADENTQIISPYNELNAQINDHLKKGEEPVNIGDKVMTLKNTKHYCNGDMGTVEKIDCKGNITISIEDKAVVIKKSGLQDLSLAYSITVHKMQGSEAERIIFLLPKNDSLIDKRMLYTAITRAKKQLEIYYYNEGEQ